MWSTIERTVGTTRLDSPLESCLDDLLANPPVSQVLGYVVDPRDSRLDDQQDNHVDSHRESLLDSLHEGAIWSTSG